MFFNKNYFQIFTICALALIQTPIVLPQQQARIVGGTVTTIKSVPYLVKLLDNGRFMCGGTIVSERHIVTAAHCVKDTTTRSLTVVANTGKINGPGIRSKVLKIIVPLGFHRPPYNMDVAVLKLKSPLRGRFIRPIPLCSGGWTTRTPIKVSGWGLTSENTYSLPNQVRTVNVRTIKKAKCASLFAGTARLTKSMFCAAVPGRKDACVGDSGGPAVIMGELCGVVSWGFGCGRRNFPGIYTNVNAVKNFIRNAMQM